MFTESYLQPIQSINLRGKLKEGVKHVGKKIGDDINRRSDKLAKGVEKVSHWLSDDLSKKEAQDFFGNAYKVGALKKVSNKDGGIWKVLTGSPSTKRYVVFYLLRNGNSVKILDQVEFSAKGDVNKVKEAQKQVISYYNAIDGEYEESTDEGRLERDIEEPISYEPEDNVIYAEDENVITDEDIVLDKDDYVIYEEGDDYVIKER